MSDTPLSPKPLIEGLPAGSQLEGVLAHRPELLERYRQFYLGLWQSGFVPVRTLELCRVRTAYIHGAEAELAIDHPDAPLDTATRESLAAGTLTSFAASEQVALELAEQMPFNHHGITDAQVHQAVSAFGEAGAVTLLTALAFFDVTCRLKLVWSLAVEPAQQQADLLV
ncbi:MAG: hypothetical protein AAF993_02865 [Pseudomonadota bacterium]